MKKLFFSFLLLAFFSSTITTFAKNRPIKVDLDRWMSERSLSIVPVLSHDQHTVYIYSNQLLENIEVKVTDTCGNIVYDEVLTIRSGETISFTLDNTESGEYLIEITHGVKYLYGWFGIY